MSAMHVDSNGILIWLYTSQDPIHVSEAGQTFTAEELCNKAAKICGISTLELQLFALIKKDHQTWLPPNTQVICPENEVLHFMFRMRAKPAVDNLRLLAENDPNAFTYIFKQCRDDFINDRMKSLYNEKISSDVAFGYCVLDMIRVAKQEDLNFEELNKRYSYQDFLPGKCIESYNLPWRKVKLKSNFKEKLKEQYSLCQDKEGINLVFQYVKGMFKTVPQYAVECFEDVDGKKITINPFNENMPGVYYNSKQDDNEQFICSIEAIMDISLSPSLKNQQEYCVQINRSQGIPKSLLFKNEEIARSFVALVDIYYRMTVNFYQHVCGEIETAYVTNLKQLKCHGPVYKDWADDQLQSAEPGTYLLKQKRDNADAYVLFLVTKNRDVISYIIRRSSDSLYRLNDRSRTIPSEGCPSVLDVMKHLYRVNEPDISLKRAIRPKVQTLKDSGLLLCCLPDSITEELDDGGSSSASNDLPTVVVINNSQLQKGPQIGKGHFTKVLKGVLKGKERKKVAIKMLDQRHMYLLQQFQQGFEKSAFWQSPFIIRTYGVCFGEYFQTITELMDLGPLDKLLKSKYGWRIKLHHLVSAAAQIGQALMYLEDNSLTHGDICCKNILVSNFERSEIDVKLKAPDIEAGLYNTLPVSFPINLERLPWIDPEHYESLREMTPQSDVFAFGVTLWEMYSGGKYPLEEFHRNLSGVKNFYTNGYLPKPPLLECNVDCQEDDFHSKLYQLIIDCMHLDAGQRKTPRDLVRDLRQLLSAIDPMAYDSLHSSENDMTSPVMNVQSPVQSPDFGLQNSKDPIQKLMEEFSQPPNGAALQEPNIVQSFLQRSQQSRPLPLTPGQGNLISPKDIEIYYNRKSLGQGFYGEVRKGKLKHNQESCAVKFLKEKHYEKFIEEFEKEIKLMTELDHPNIVKIYGQVPLETGDLHIGLVMEFCDHGSLKSILLRRGRATNHDTLVAWSIEIAEGMKYLCEDKKIVHRDLATRNVLVTLSDHCKISDFGLSRILDPNKDYYKSDPQKNIPAFWCSPEAMEKRRFTIKSDVWAYGVTLWEMFMYGKKPGHRYLSEDARDDDDADPDSREAEKFYYRLIDGKRLRKPQDCEDVIYNLMLHCWKHDPIERPIFSDLLLKLYDIQSDLRL